MGFLESIKPALTSLEDVALILLIILLTVIAAKIFRKIFTLYVEKSSEELRVNIRQYLFLKHFVTALIYFSGIGLAVYLIEPLRNLSLSIFAGSGILAVIVGFAAQQSLSNVVSGIFITIFKPFRVGDRVRMVSQNIDGIIEDITLRHTILRTYENKRIVVPNSIISTEVIENSSLKERRVCRFVEIGISYDADMNKAIKIMQEEATKHPECIDTRTAQERKDDMPIVIVRLISFGDSSVNLRAYVWAKNQTIGFQMGCDLNKSIKERFDEEGITIPFPQRDLHIKSSEINFSK